MPGSYHHQFPWWCLSTSILAGRDVLAGSCCLCAVFLIGVSVRGSCGEQRNVVLAVWLHFFDYVVADLLMDCLLALCWLVA